jgi:predicted MFS family arabinose efflux permease
VLSLGSAVSLGLARFAYALLLPPMRSDLGWSYLLAGAMNTANAAGYLVGALAMPAAIRGFGVRRTFVLGAVATAVLLACHAATRSDLVLGVLRLLSGAASAATFVGGGVLAARLASRAAAGGAGPTTGSGLVLGLYYGGTGLGIIASSFLVPPLVGWPASGWPGAWLALGGLAAAAAALLARHTEPEPPPAGAGAQQAGFERRRLAWGLAGYLMFGLGYIGYMTFIVTLLREQALTTGVVVAFYALLGAGVIASSWLWAGLLQRHRDGRALALLNALLALATVLPVLTAHPLAAFVSGALFGSVFLSVVAATTALVRHNLPPAAWPAGIGLFTVVFAAGQIVGPGLVGWLSDGAGGLRAGLAVSAGLLALGALLAWRQPALDAR